MSVWPPVFSFIFSLSFTMNSIAFANNCNDSLESMFEKAEQDYISAKMLSFQHRFLDTYFKIKKDIYDKNYNKIDKIYSHSKSYDLIKVLNKRLDKSFDFVVDLSLDNIFSINWAQQCHPNEDFKNFGIPQEKDELNDVYALVNYYGQQKAHELNYQIDNRIYLGPMFFEDQAESFITLIHEVSHLVEGSYIIDEENNFQSVDEKVDPYVVTHDNFTDLGEANQVEVLRDSYAWEKFIELYLE